LKVTKSRSLVKAFSYRIWGSLTSFIVVLIFTGSAELSGLIAFWETVIKVVVYYIHERGWNFIQWGRRG
jgi:adenylylsulfate kinase